MNSPKVWTSERWIVYLNKFAFSTPFPILPSAELTHRSCGCTPSSCPERFQTEMKTPEAKVFFFLIKTEHRQISANANTYYFLFLSSWKVCDQCYQDWVDIWKRKAFLSHLLHCRMFWWKKSEWIKHAYSTFLSLVLFFPFQSYYDGSLTCLSFSEIF